MVDKVRLRIELPNAVMPEMEANGVIIPAVAGDVTILSERAPSVYALDYGMVQLLDANMKPFAKYYISAGVADVAQGEIKLMTGQVLKADEVTKSEAEVKAQNDVFYQMIVDKMDNKTAKYC